MRQVSIAAMAVAGLSILLLVEGRAQEPAGPETDSLQAAAIAAGERIDGLLAEEVFSSPTQGTSEPAPLTSDQVFLRRLTLDLAGRLPTPGEVTAFALDPSADKRWRAAERLLADEAFGRNWARYWRDVIFYRRSNEQALLAARTVEDYLSDEFNSGAGWDEIARSFVEATGDVREQGSTGLIMAQMAETAEVASETSRIFLGVQIQCAQCHDHPTDRWKRQQFHELAAFFPRVALRPVRDGMMRTFEVASRDRGGPGRRPGNRRGALEHHMPDLADPSARGTLMTPTFFLTGAQLETGTSDLDRRTTLADWMTAESNPWFARAFVNRIWAELVGEGFYEPIDDLGPDRSCSAPATMEFLSSEFIASGYNVKWLFAAITASEAYQRESRPRRNPDETPFLANRTQPLRSDQVFDVLTTALGVNPEGQRRGRMAGGYGRGGPRGQFAATFGYDPSDPRDEVAASIPQALLLMNSRMIAGAINAGNPRGMLGRVLQTTSDNEQVVLELYLRCLAREPSNEELAACLVHVRTAPDRGEAFEDILWALLNRTEFVLRH
ncbi:MAG: DUF1549 domain-containing protein [Pirellulales bacterium]